MGAIGAVLVGRTSELAILGDRWHQVCQREGQVVSISGEAGIGKTRLVNAFRQSIADTPHIWLGT